MPLKCYCAHFLPFLITIPLKLLFTRCPDRLYVFGVEGLVFRVVIPVAEPVKRKLKARVRETSFASAVTFTVVIPSEAGAMILILPSMICALEEGLLYVVPVVG